PAPTGRLTAPEPLPGGGARARFRRRLRLPVGDELAVGAFALLRERRFASAHLSERVGGGAASAAAASGLAGAQLERAQLLRGQRWPLESVVLAACGQVPAEDGELARGCDDRDLHPAAGAGAAGRGASALWGSGGRGVC